MSSSQNLFVVSHQLIKTFIVTLVSTLFVIFLFSLKSNNQPLPTINQLSTTAASLSLTTDANQPLDPDTTFNIKVEYFTTQPAHFIQIVFEFDPQALEYTGQIEKLHSFPFHKQEYLADKNQIRISAIGVNPDNLEEELQPQSGDGSLAKISFKVKPNAPAAAKLTIISSSADKPWEQSAIIQIDSDLQVINLLSQTINLDLTFTQSQASSPSPNGLFPILTDIATPVEPATSSATPSSQSSPSSTLASDPNPSSIPSPPDQNLSWWQQLQLLIAQCRFNLACYFQS